MNEYQTVDSNDAPLETNATFKFLDVATIAVGSLGIILIGSFMLFSWANINIFDTNMKQEPSIFLNVSMAALEGIALLFSVYIFGIRRRHMSWQDLGLKSTSYKWILGAILVVIIFIPIIAAVAVLIQYLLGLPYENPQLEFLIPDQFSWAGAAGMLVLGGFVVPFAEELFFRGVLYQWLRNKAGVWVGIFGSSLVFGLLHGEASVAGATFVMGIVLAWVFERSNSLWPSVTIHIVNNSIKIILLYALIAFGVSL